MVVQVKLCQEMVSQLKRKVMFDDEKTGSGVLRSFQTNFLFQIIGLVLYAPWRAGHRTRGWPLVD